MNRKRQPNDRFGQLLKALGRTGAGTMRFEGGSMRPLIESGVTLKYRVCAEYQIGDIVFCKVNGRFIDAHRIADKRADGTYLIANHRGKENGWTKEVFARVELAESQDSNHGRSTDDARRREKGSPRHDE